ERGTREERERNERGTREERRDMAPTSPHSPAQVLSLDLAQPERHLPQVRDLINAHLGLLVPGWTLTDAFIAHHLRHNPGEAVTDPWMRERATLCALHGTRVMAAAHL